MANVKWRNKSFNHDIYTFLNFDENWEYHFILYLILSLLYFVQEYGGGDDDEDEDDEDEDDEDDEDKDGEAESLPPSPQLQRRWKITPQQIRQRAENWIMYQRTFKSQC